MNSCDISHEIADTEAAHNCTAEKRMHAMQARVISVEAVYSPPRDSALAICARASQSAQELSMRAKVLLRVVPGPLASATAAPSNPAGADSPDGFFAFMRGASRARTHVQLQARDACGNALTRDIPEGLEVGDPERNIIVLLQSRM